MPRLTPNRRAFEREQKRLQRIISTERKREHISINASDVIPKMPSIVTKKRLEEIQRITRSDILSSAEKYNIETGQWEHYQIPKSRPRNIAAIQPLKTEREIRKIRKQAAKQAAKTRAYHRSPEYREERREAIRRKARTEYGIYDKDLIEELEEASDKILSREMTEDELLELLTRKQREQEELDYFQWEVEEEQREEEERQRQKELEEYNEYLEDRAQENEEPEPDIFEEPDEEEDAEEYDDFEEPLSEDYDVPAFSTQIIEYIRAQADMAENINIATLIRDILNKQIEIEGYEEVANRIADSNEDLITMFETVMYDSDLQEVFQNAEAIVDTITGDGFSFMNDLHFAIMEDADNNYYKGGFK